MSKSNGASPHDNDDSEWLREVPLTRAELATYRQEVHESNVSDGCENTAYSCDGCKLANRCLLAFDSANVVGTTCLYDEGRDGAALHVAESDKNPPVEDE